MDAPSARSTLPRVVLAGPIWKTPGKPMRNKQFPVGLSAAPVHFGTEGGHINIDVQNSVVTLRGHVATEDTKIETGRIAKETDGVKRVNNQLMVQAE